MKKLVHVFMLAMLLVGCHGGNETIARMEEIKLVGNDNATLALSMLDSLRPIMAAQSEYAQMRFRLLDVRLHDKADITHTSDSAIKTLIPFFDNEGSMLDRQEAYYYAGSVYRDLNDTPRALECFLTSLDLAKKGECDTVMLRNTFSNLNCLYYNVQDFDNALATAVEEMRMNEILGCEEVSSYIHAAVAYLCVDSDYIAIEYFDKALDMLLRDDIKDEKCALLLMDYYSNLNQREKAAICRDYALEHRGDQRLQGAGCMAFGNFYLSTNQLDSAEYYYKEALQSESIDDRYNAHRFLIYVYTLRGDLASAGKYASRFIAVSDTLNFGERQRMAARANNEFQYYRDRDEEMQMTCENERMNRLVAVISLLSMLAIALLIVMHIYIKRITI